MIINYKTLSYMNKKEKETTRTVIIYLKTVLNSWMNACFPYVFDFFVYKPNKVRKYIISLLQLLMIKIPIQ